MEFFKISSIFQIFTLNSFISSSLALISCLNFSKIIQKSLSSFFDNDKEDFSSSTPGFQMITSCFLLPIHKKLFISSSLI